MGFYGVQVVKTSSEFHFLPDLDKVAVSFDKLNNTGLFHSIHGVYIQYLHWFQLESFNSEQSIS